MITTKYRTLRAACEWSKGLGLRADEGSKSTSPFTQGFGGVFDFVVGFVCQVKNCDKTEARSDQQASQLIATVGFLVFAGGTEAITKNTKELQ